MKILVASLLTLIGSCANERHSDKVKNLRASIVYNEKEAIKTFMTEIDVDDLKTHVYEISDGKYGGRMTGEKGHNDICNYIRYYYDSLNVTAPVKAPDYFQIVPKSELPENLNESQNVIAYIEGSEFPDEYVYITAHSDHEGIIAGATYYGADDNGSGTAAVLEIAEAFKTAAESGYPPKRSVVFLHVTAEEVGLYGSRFYTNNPIFPIENTVVTLNTDMIGRVDALHSEDPNYVYVIGSDRMSTELDYIIQKANDEFVNLNLDYKYNASNDVNRYYSRSDHYNFALKGIPVAFFFNGEHEDYSKPSDTPDKINYPLLKKRTDLIFTTAWYIANSPTKLSVELL
ncbi:M28 family metallopeptidase [Winogradskyella sp. A3E31]|uniref:M28 family metallopeptidase n=1 Tax=Winogradskyella sp. A3E31 TaxID=3349637 RepID=UPI00398B2ACC